MRLDVEKIRATCPGNQIVYFPSLGTTMEEAARLANEGAAHGTTVLADEQTSGVGRFGRAWLSEAEVGIYCSVILRLSLLPSSVPVAALLLGLATAEAIQKSTNLVCDLRWPNDVLINGHKVGGILAQMVDACVIAGIGINVNQTEFPNDLRTPATSLRIESGGEPQPRERVIIRLLEAIDSFVDLLKAQGPAAILRAFTSSSSYAANRRVLVEETGQRGTTAGLDDSGFLLLRLDSGVTQRIATGGVRAV